MCDQGSLAGLCIKHYKSLCVAVTTYSTLVVPKLIRTFWPSVTLKSRSNPTLLYIHVRCTDDANLVTAGPRDTAHKYFCDHPKTDESMSGWPTFCVRSGFGSGSSDERVQRLRFVPPYFPHLSILIPLTWKSMSSSRDVLHPCQVHPRSKVGDRRSASCRDNADISIWMMTLKTQ